MTTKDIEDMGYEEIAPGQYAKRNRDNRPLPDAKPKRNEAPALVRPEEREAQSVERPVASFVGYRVRPLDPDNFAGSVKDLLDGLRHSKLIPGDENWRIKLETEQVKVKSYKEEKTIIRITYP